MNARLVWLALWSASLAILGCETAGSTLSIDVRTDLVPGPEFDTVEVTLFDDRSTRASGSESLRDAARVVRFEDATGLRGGQRVIDFRGVADGTYTVRVRLRRPPRGTGLVLVERWVSFEMRRSTRIAVTLNAACVPVTCPSPGGSAAFSECIAGRCVTPFCDENDPTTWAEHCCDPTDPTADCSPEEPRFCLADADCGEPTPCSRPRCDRGVCLQEPVEDACEAGEYCGREVGCLPVPDPRVDAGPPDGGVCVPTFCARDESDEPCFLYRFDCATGRCDPYAPRPAGTACGGASLCSNDGDCLVCPGVPLCDAASDVDRDGVPDRSDLEDCDDVDNDGDGEVDEGLVLEPLYRDADGDGYGVEPASPVCPGTFGRVARSMDCDDDDPRRAPGSPESCNGSDDDCDGRSDEGLTTLSTFRDTDGDGYGAGEAMTSCSVAPGFVLRAGDCSPDDPAVHPAALDPCDGRDTDCDGMVDETGAVAYFPDGDGDTFGDRAAAFTRSCTPLPGYVSNDFDCDDSRATVGPTAPEICDGRDNNCNGLTDTGEEPNPLLCGGGMDCVSAACRPQVLATEVLAVGPSAQIVLASATVGATGSSIVVGVADGGALGASGVPMGAGGFVARVGDGGDVSWSTSFGEETAIYDVAVVDGSVFAVGLVRGGTAICGTTLGGATGVVMKLEVASGACAWAAPLLAPTGGPEAFLWPIRVEAFTELGRARIAVSGSSGSWSSESSLRPAIALLEDGAAAPTVAWSRTLATRTGWATGLAHAGARVHAVGWVSALTEPYELAGESQTGRGEDDAFLVTLDVATGSTTRALAWGDAGVDRAHGVIDVDGAPVVLGRRDAATPIESEPVFGTLTGPAYTVTRFGSLPGGALWTTRLAASRTSGRSDSDLFHQLVRDADRILVVAAGVQAAGLFTGNDGLALTALSLADGRPSFLRVLTTTQDTFGHVRRRGSTLEWTTCYQGAAGLIGASPPVADSHDSVRFLLEAL